MNKKKREIVVVAGPESVAEKAAEIFLTCADEAVSQRGFFSVALSGGSTPKALFALLSGTQSRFRGEVPWGKTHFFWGDERYVPPEHPESNFRMAKETLLKKAQVHAKNIHPVPTELESPDVSAKEYELELQRFFRLQEGEFPKFDLILLGMGGDGHTASLFPGSTVLAENRRLVAADPVVRAGFHRITLTPPVLNNADCAMFLVSGESKAQVFSQIIEGKEDIKRYPAQIVSPEKGRCVWVIDRAAGKLIQT